MNLSRSSAVLCIFSSAVLLLLSFPNFNQPWCAWAALVPWLVVLPRLSPRHAFGWSYLVGFLFFLGSVWWLVYLTPFGGVFAIIGWLLLCAYLALYFGLFGYLVRCSCLLPSAFCLLFVPSTWVALEYLRSHALSGFGWNLLGYSQVPSLSAIQIADATGVWGVSWLIVAVNVALTRVVLERDRRRMLTASLLAAGLMAASWQYAQRRLQAFPAQAESTFTVALVQGNIPQEQKWSEQFQSRILQQYERLTMQAVSSPSGRPDLIIWPETSVPGILGVDSVVSSRVRGLAAAAQRPLLAGAPMAVADARGAVHLTNSAALFDANGTPRGRYDKQHLVPFGEFVPGASAAPWLRDVLPSIGDFVPGDEPTVFSTSIRDAEFGMRNTNAALRTPHSALKFGVLICFEDIFPDLARTLVNRGARMLVTITNDAWFGPTAAAYQHAQASTLRAVELRVPMVRAANTGWSGCIDAAGRWTGSVRNDAGAELFVDGTASCHVSAADTPTLYRRFGDWFAWFCVLVCLGSVTFAKIKGYDGFQRPDRQPAGEAPGS